MGVCEQCHNDYDKTFDVIIDGKKHTFDCFECAIEATAPRCENCKCHIIGHGIEADGHFFCCASCAETAGVVGARDHV